MARKVIKLTPEQVKSLEEQIKKIEGFDVKIEEKDEKPATHLAVSEDDCKSIKIPSCNDSALRKDIYANAFAVDKFHNEFIDSMRDKSDYMNRAMSIFENEYETTISGTGIGSCDVTVEDKYNSYPSGCMLGAVMPGINSAIRFVEANNHFTRDISPDEKQSIINSHNLNFNTTANSIIRTMVDDIQKAFSGLIIKHALTQEEMDKLLKTKTRMNMILNKDEVVNLTPSDISSYSGWTMPVDSTELFTLFTTLRNFHSVTNYMDEDQIVISGNTINYYVECIYNYATTSFFQFLRYRFVDNEYREDIMSRISLEFETNFGFEMRRYIAATLKEIARIATIYLMNLKVLDSYPKTCEKYAEGNRLINPPFRYWPGF